MRVGKITLSRITPWLLVATLTAAGAAAAAGYGLTAPKRYRATAQLLVSPVAATDSTFTGFDLLRDANGKARAAQSAAVLVRSPQVADAVRTQLALRRSSSSLLRDLHVHVVGASDVVDVTDDDTSAASAAQIANAFVDALIAQRTTTFQSELGSAIRRDAQLLSSGPAGPQAAGLARRLAALRSLQGQPDPTLRRATTAIAPSSSSWPVLWVLVLVGAGIGLATGVAVFLLLAVARRRGGGEPAQYSRGMSAGMSDRAVNALVERLEQRLAARASALAVRERELQAKIDELRALEARRAAGARDDSSQASAADEAALAERERQLEERVAAVQARELAVARAAARAPARDELSQAPAAVPAAQAPARTPPQTPAPAPAPAEALSGSFNLETIARLVAEQGAAHPDRVDEWRSTVFFLRDYAGPDGALPGSFDWLVQDTFAPLLG